MYYVSLYLVRVNVVSHGSRGSSELFGRLLLDSRNFR